MTVSTRPKKRHRTASYDEQKETVQQITWGEGILALVDRLDSIRSQAVALRDGHIKSIAEIDDNIALRSKAKRAVARASVPAEADDLDILSKVVSASPSSSLSEATQPEPKPTPALKLLMGTDPPEKVIHEQSIIVRAQAINRKNAELARERLPKQPEAQRNKTHHDYYLDEAVWMATDFKEERKLKIHLARKVSRMIVQFHAQRQRRNAKARLEAHQRILKLASTVAKEVRKFWSQIGEVADYRSTLVEEARQTQERRVQLRQLVEQTDQYTKQMATSLHDPSQRISQQIEDEDAEINETNLLERDSEKLAGSEAMQRSHRQRTSHPWNSLRPDSSVERAENTNAFEENDGNSSPGSASEREYDVADSMEVDDESTLLVAEAEEGDDSAEVQTLTNQATMSVDALLRSQGIDPSVYKADTKDYLTASEEDSIDTSMDGDIDAEEDVGDDESTMAVAEAEEANDLEEGRRLQDENEKSVEELLRLQGIDPNVYFADKKNYLKEEEESSAGRRASKESPEQGKEGNAPNGGSTNATDVAKSNGTDRDSSDAINHRSPGSSNLPETHVQVPMRLLRGTLRSYQQAGMEWLVSLHKQNLNGILADEMGLGKTIQTIALLAWLAVERGVWGPHLIVVPTSVMVNWEVEFKKWLPGFKIMTYFGSMKERKLKRQGWTKPNLFHVCITSYRLAVQDATILRRKKWVYLILDEAHNIKNFESQRWQTLLSFSSQRRLLLTGTPLQNSVMELWSLMHFLTPDIFSSHSEFKGWFSKPLIEAAEAEGEQSADRLKVVANLHRVLRPFLLRRLKADVEKGLPPKFEHVIKCHLSKRQRQLYEDFISRNDVKETLQSENLEGIVSVLIQLKKVCNHPDLFEGRPIISPFSMSAVFFPIPSCVPNLIREKSGRLLNLRLLNLELASIEETSSGGWYRDEAERLSATSEMKRGVAELQRDEDTLVQEIDGNRASAIARRRRISARRAFLSHMVLVNAMRIRQRALLGEDLRSVVTLTPRSLVESLRLSKASHDEFLPCAAPNICRTIASVALRARTASDRFVCCITKATAPLVEMRYRGDDMRHRLDRQKVLELGNAASAYRSLFRSFEVRSKVTIPDARLIQWDCGKLQIMARLLRQLRAINSRVLIFTQMAKVLDVLESFLNLHSYRYLRLDGTTKPDDRQKLVERFNTDERVFCMILTTRAGGVGLNLTGANSVIFYDTDYNPAIDNQAQDRAHRIGQTKPVHVYRLVSEQTVEENILKRANEKRSLEAAVITNAGFTTEAITKPTTGIPSSEAQEGRTMPDSDLRKLSPSETDSVKNGLSLNAKESISIIKESEGNGETERAGRPSTLQSDESGVVCSYGRFNGFVSDAQEVPHRSEKDLNVRNMDEYQEVTARLLAKEDEREKLALHMAEQEEKELRAEFEDSKPEDAGDAESASTAHKAVLKDYDKIKSSLTPIQLYALRVVERWREADRDLHEGIGELTHVQKQLTVGKKDAVFLEEKGKIPECSEDGDVAPEEETDPIFYDLDATEAGQRNYLKVLTDADADIKLYLPLRDGGPEELKVSSVVSGTAAAGLECAEDAAFFPHAYNRMSRTPFATRRQREKGLANFRKRKAEREAKRQREMQQVAAANAAAAAAAAAAARKPASVAEGPATQHQALRIANASEKTKGTKKQIDTTRSGSVPFSKKQRADNVSKSKASVSSGSLPSAEAVQNSSMGLFRRPTKKNVRRLSLPGGRSGLVSAASGMPGDGLGINDGWTTEEDKQLISTASEFNNNMVLVADLLSSDPRVAAGLRRYRSHTHCIDRLINCLGKDKSGPPSVKAASSDEDVFRSHQAVLRQVINRAQEKGPSWMILPPSSVDLHASHKKAIALAAAKMKPASRKDKIPPFKAIFDAYEIPKHYRSGNKTTETTPQAMSKMRYPFLRPPRDDPRALHQRGTGQPSRYNGAPSGQGPLHRGDPNLFTKTSQKALRGQQQQSAQRNVSQGRSSGTTRMAHATKSRSDTGSSRNVGTVNAPQNASGMPLALHPSRKGYFVPGTGGRISIGQYGNTVQHIPNAHAYGSGQPKVGGLKPSVSAGAAGRVAAPVTSLKPGIRKAAPPRIPTSVASLKPPGGQSTVPRVLPQSQAKMVTGSDMARSNISGIPHTNGLPNSKAPVVSGGPFIGGTAMQHRTVGLPPGQSLARARPQRVTSALVMKPTETNRVGDHVTPAQMAKNSAVTGNHASSSSTGRVAVTNGTKVVHRAPAPMAGQSGASQIVAPSSMNAAENLVCPPSVAPGDVVRRSGSDTKGTSDVPMDTGQRTSFGPQTKAVSQPNTPAEHNANAHLGIQKTIPGKQGQKPGSSQTVTKSDSELEKR